MHAYGLNINSTERVIMTIPSPPFSIPHPIEIATLNPLSGLYFCLYCYFLVYQF